MLNILDIWRGRPAYRILLHRAGFILIEVAEIEPITGGIQMAYTINEECINCGACEPVCPVEAISEKDDKRVIDPEKCTSCGACKDECPVEAIKEG